MPPTLPLVLPILRRVRFFSGQLLTAEDFQLEQEYHRERSRLHNRLLHGWGVVDGFDVRSRAGMIIVSPGLAFDPSGDEIILPHDTPLSVAPGSKGGPSLYVIARYAEVLTDPVASPGGTTDGTEFSRVVEGAVLELQDSVPRTPHAGVAIARLLWRTTQWRVDARYRRRRIKK